MQRDNPSDPEALPDASEGASGTFDDRPIVHLSLGDRSPILFRPGVLIWVGEVRYEVLTEPDRSRKFTARRVE